MITIEEKKILLVDDQPEILQTIADSFSEENLPYKVLRAPNGKIALTLAKSRNPDLIITDWDMPNMNGISLIEALKTNPDTQNVPVIMCTGVMATSKNLDTAIRAGAVDFIRKPIDKIELLARVHSMLCLSESYQKISKQKEELAAEKLKVEMLLIDSQLDFLRSQVSPHFLMNTLNNIHALIDIDGEEAKSSIIILSQLMRHLLYESDHKRNLISKEMDFIRNYVDLMKLRVSDKVDVRLQIDETLPNNSIPPLLFTSLLENAFKHGITKNKDSFIHINIQSSDSTLTFEIKNGIPNRIKSNAHSGIGLKNTRKRLDLLYGNNCDLLISDDDDVYVARLTVPLN